MMTDPISDMLTRIRNANMVKMEVVDIPASNIKLSIADILEKQGFIRGFTKINDGKQGILRIAMKYSEQGEGVIHVIKRVSLPSRKKYLKVDDIQESCGGMGIAILSTSQGIFTGDEAKRRNIGGEFLCEVW